MSVNLAPCHAAREHGRGAATPRRAPPPICRFRPGHAASDRSPVRRPARRRRRRQHRAPSPLPSGWRTDRADAGHRAAPRSGASDCRARHGRGGAARPRPAATPSPPRHVAACRASASRQARCAAHGGRGRPRAAAWAWRNRSAHRDRATSAAPSRRDCAREHDHWPSECRQGSIQAPVRAVCRARAPPSAAAMRPCAPARPVWPGWVFLFAPEARS